MEKELLDLLEDYHHYKTMSAGPFIGLFRGWGAGMNLCDFMLWLHSRKP
jgi:hypothetical protein